MTKYRIAPAEVQTVLTTTQSEAEEFGDILTPLQGHVETAAAGTNPEPGTAGGSGVIVPALASFIEAQAEGIEAISTRISAALTGGS